MALFLERYTVGPLQENCYLVGDTELKEAVLVDPGDEAGRLLETERHLTLKAIWLTHAHFDHVGAVADVLEKFPSPYTCIRLMRSYWQSR
ncbi:MAG: MBL fold metallo-hydrolase [Deinococcales bacterium]